MIQLIQNSFKICKFFGIGLIASMLFLSGCGSNSDNGDADNSGNNSTTTVAIISTVAADFSAGAHAIVSTSEPNTVKQNLSPTVSDITVRSFGDFFYRIERFNGDNITKFKTSDPTTPIWQYKTLDSGDETSGNPQDVVFLNETKAYVLRYSKTTVWVVNPSATTEAEFKIGEIDLSAYDDGDGTVEMESGIIVDGKLYIAMQRLDTNNFSFAPQDAYVAVIDTSTDKEIVTNNDGALPGIKLPVKNTIDMQYLEEDSLIYIQGQGRFASFDGTRPAEFDGGVATIDPDTYITELVLDDGDNDTNTFGLITQMEIVSANKGYFVGYKNFDETSLYSFNPITAAVNPIPVADLVNKNFGDIALDSKKQIWIGVSADAASGDSAKLVIIDPKDDSFVKEKIELDLNPTTIVFGKTTN